MVYFNVQQEVIIRRQFNISLHNRAAYTKGLKNTHRWLTDIYIQNASHGKDKEFDWLPAPEGRFKLMLHMYLPEEQILN